MYLIAGVSGNTGAAAATALLEKRQPVRVLVRSEDKELEKLTKHSR